MFFWRWRILSKMRNLILIELRKLLNKKSILVIMVIILGFSLLNNILFYTDYDDDGNYKYLEYDDIVGEKELLKEKLDEYDYNDEKQVSLYVDVKTKLDVLEIQEKYAGGSWQYNKASDYLYDVLENINIYTYENNNEELREEYRVCLNDLLLKFERGDWKYFVNEEIANLEKDLSDLRSELSLLADDVQIKKLNVVISDKEREVKDLKYRLDNDVAYDNSYLNVALNSYNEALEKINYYEERMDNLTRKQQVEYQDLKEDLEVNKYILDNKVNYNKQNNLNYQLRTIVDDYEIFVVIIILIITSTIVAEEFTSGTIKLLLIKPYFRGKILLSKYFASIIMLCAIIIYLVLLQLLIGGYIFGFSSLELPVIVYDFNKECIVEYNVFIYMFIRIIAKLPLLVMILTISFSLGTIFNSVVTAIALPLFVYIFTSSINYLMLQYKVDVFKYLVNVNWEFNNYLFGKKVSMDGLNFSFSLGVWIIYFIGIMIFTYIDFKRKNIKNV